MQKMLHNCYQICNEKCENMCYFANLTIYLKLTNSKQRKGVILCGVWGESEKIMGKKDKNFQEIIG